MSQTSTTADTAVTVSQEQVLEPVAAIDQEQAVARRGNAGAAGRGGAVLRGRLRLAFPRRDPAAGVGARLRVQGSQPKTALFDGIFRGLRRGGRAAISDIVSSTEVPERLRADPALWNGLQLRGVAAVPGRVRAGWVSRHPSGQMGRVPWQVVEGIEVVR